MARNGFFTGLDIGTSSIKVLVAEFVSGEMNVIGVSNVPSTGVKDGIIIDIEAAAEAIKTAIEQAEEKAGVTIDKINVGLPANLLQIEPTQGMIPVPSESKEIKDEDVDSVVKSALTKSITPEREVISLIPEEFIVDGFQGIRDPRGMMGIRLEMRGLIYTGPTTILHNLRKTVERAGISVENVIISPLALAKSVLNEGEREFGATVIDMGGGQTTVASISVSERYLSEIISARVRHILDRVKQDLERGRLLDLPGGIILVGGGAIMPGVVEVAQEIFGTTVKLHVPNQVGIRNPMFANVISLVEYVGTMSEVDVIAQRAVSGEELLRRKPVDFEPQPQVQAQQRVVYNNEPVVPVNENMVQQPAPVQPVQRHEEPKSKFSERVRGIFGSMFD